MNLRIGVWLLVACVSLLSCSGQEPIEDVNLEAAGKVRERIESIENSLRGWGLEDGEVAALSTGEMWEACEWVLSEFGNWPYRERDYSTKSGDETPEPFGVGDPFADGGPGREEEEVPDVYDFTSLLSDLCEALFLEDSREFAVRYPRLLSQYPEACSDPYFQGSLLTHLLLIRLWEMAEIDAPKEMGSRWLDEGEADSTPAILSSSGELRDVWTLAQKVRGVLESSSGPGLEDEEIGVGQDSQFYRIQFAGLLDDDWSEWEKIRRYTWGHFCGVGSEEFQWQRLAYLALAQAEQGDVFVSRALLMCVAGPFRSFLMMVDEKVLGRWSELLWSSISNSEGPWEKVVAGMVLFPTPYFGWSSVPTECADEDAIRLICEGVELDESGTEIDGKATLEFLLDFINDGLIKTPDLRLTVSDMIANLVRVVEDPYSQTVGISHLGRVSPQRYQDSLRELAEYPVPSVSQRAVGVLKNAGLDGDGGLPVVKRKSYRLRLTAGGNPLSNLNVSLGQVLAQKSGDGYTAFGGLWADSVALDDDGGFGFTRIDATHVSDTRGMIRLVPSQEGTENGSIEVRVDTPVFSLSKQYRELDGERVNQIEVAPHEFAFRVVFPEGREFDPVKDGNLVIQFTHTYPGEKEGSGSAESVSSYYRMETDRFENRLSHVGEGMLNLQIAAPGCQVFQTEVKIGEDSDRIVECQLEPGFALRYSVEGRSEGEYFVQLFEQESDDKGDEFESEIHLYEPWMGMSDWEHLGPGKYRFLVHGTGLDGKVLVEKEFLIEGNDPQIFDLGKVVVPENE